MAEASYTPRLLERYRQQVASELMERFKYQNRMELPRLSKVTVNIGLGEALTNAKLLEGAVAELGQITGQKAVINKARKSIANFRLREGMSIGTSVTLRRTRMWEFFDRFVNVALPRVRDFRGLPLRGFDGRGNYTIGIREQIIFPEVNYDKVERIQGMNVTIVTTAKTDDEARTLLGGLGMPFRQ